MDTVYLAGNLVAAVLWAALLASLFWSGSRPTIWRLTGIVAPALFAVAYIALLVAAPEVEGGGFSSAREVAALFANPVFLNAGWFHYLAFDLFVGTWIAREGLAARVPGWALAPCLLLTFLVGPAGFLLFLVVRLAFSRFPGAVREVRA